MEVNEFRLKFYESQLPAGRTPISAASSQKLNNRIIEAAICQAGRMPGHEKMFDDQTMQLAHDQFRGNIGLKQLLLLAAEQNGYRANYATEVNMDVQRAAFNMQGRMINATGFSTISISTILSNVANKFLMVGWNSVDMTPLNIAPVRNVRDYKQITTVSLTGDLQYEALGQGGEIKHGTLGNQSYTNQADIYARMLAITEKDIVNDDLGALTATPQRLGRGAALKLNDLFWTEFLNNSAFFTTGRTNVNEGVADMTIGGLDATETIFTNQTDPDGKPLGLMAKILLVPTALKNKALALVDPLSRVQSGNTSGQPDVNVFAGRFRVESSPYMSNSAYTGYSAAAWYMLADPMDMPVIEIAALNGRVEPVVETADADFNVLGIQMRGKSSVGVNLQEYRAGVRADGGAS
jgi:phage major head subunit gpT-like protein